VTDDLDYMEPEVQALIRAYVACRVAMDAMPDLPPTILLDVEDAVTKLCHAVGPELQRRHPGFFGT
jgi:hypothetical protein